MSLTASELRALFEAVPDAYLVLSPTLEIVAVSDAYVRATLTRREDIVGRGLFAVFPDNPDDPGADGLANLRASLHRVLTAKRPETMPIQKYDIRRPEAEGGGLEERHWSPLNTPVLDERGEVAFIIHRVEDATARAKLERDAAGSAATIGELETRAEDRFRTLLDTAPDAIVVVGPRSLIEFVNVEAERLFGYARSELVGRSVELLVPESARASHPAHVEAYLSAPGPRPMGGRVELAARRKDGSEVPVEISLSPLRTGAGPVVLAAIRDVSDRRRIERDRRLAAERLESALEQSMPIAIFDKDDRLIQCNAAYRHLLADVVPGPLDGRTRTELLRAKAASLVPDDASRPRFEDPRSVRPPAGAMTVEVGTRDGRTLRVIDRATPEGGTVTLVNDVTEDVQRLDELSAARRAAEEANAAKTEFLSSMSHELRTPLNAILGFAQLLQRDRKSPLDSRQEVRVAHILRGGRHLLHLIDDVLDLSRIESRNLAISPEAVTLRELLREVEVTIGPAAATASVSVEGADVPPGLPAVHADRTRLSQILTNFASNAVKYNRAGGRVSFRVERVGPERVRITVADTGLGIPREKQALLFQPFQRAGQETGPIEGTGIGLAISRRLAEMMGGSIGFTSTPGEGSEFWVEMPVEPAEAASAAPQAGKSAPPSGGRKAGRVLYVEDNPANVAFMEELVQGIWGLDLVVARTAEEGVALARASPPDAILMDINLPGMSGLEALAVLRALPETANVPIIALTAAASQRDRERGLAAGFQAYLTKPVDIAVLETALSSVLSTS